MFEASPGIFYDAPVTNTIYRFISLFISFFLNFFSVFVVFHFREQLKIKRRGERRESFYPRDREKRRERQKDKKTETATEREHCAKRENLWL